jgi:Raf kinase inhibitor-like YbhB/YbcL family protein
MPVTGIPGPATRPPHPLTGWRRAGVLLAAVLAIGAAGCGHSAPSGSRTPTVPVSITVSSAAFQAGERIPAAYTCDGKGSPPPLSWTGVRAGGSVALVVDDPDAPNGTFTHWVLAGLPAADGTLRPGALPSGAVQALNSAGSTGWTPPCPPSGTHHYRFTVYALTGPAPFRDGASTVDALSAVRAAASATGTLVGLYSGG